MNTVDINSFIIKKIIKFSLKYQLETIITKYAYMTLIVHHPYGTNVCNVSIVEARSI